MTEILAFLQWILSHPLLIFADAFGLVFGIQLANALTKSGYRVVANKLEKSKPDKKIGF